MKARAAHAPLLSAKLEVWTTLRTSHHSSGGTTRRKSPLGVASVCFDALQAAADDRTEDASTEASYHCTAAPDDQAMEARIGIVRRLKDISRREVLSTSRYLWRSARRPPPPLA
ncbi:hypothetical protein F442_11580 [Phytophthora nicotianae P10297]|nr:hypothetical protein F443_11681 [Phytophthora nicotianae P1569]ETM43283.1 hypothetical protein L914_11211 [Phytophthora nicotianae]ETO72006.1 hypothetical protein F444_11761 [Phytophthora nicotianae P1976]ETP41222.1 hypothetical protein F442_11580 [Phytophthora nicotianae P10297]